MKTNDKKTPSKLKLIVLVWLVVFPMILLLGSVIDMLFSKIHYIIKSLVLSLTLVSSMIYFIMPFLNKVFGKWLQKKH